MEPGYAPPRRSPRILFAAEARATEVHSGEETWGKTTNLSKGGCYVRTRQPFQQGTLLLIEIRNRGVRFVTDARVAYALERDGMGVSFLNVPVNQIPILDGWLSCAVEEQPMQIRDGQYCTAEA